MDHFRQVLAAGTSTGRVLVFNPHVQRARPTARLTPRRAAAGAAKQERTAPLVRQTAVSYDGSIIVSCHDDGSLTRYDRVEDRSTAAAFSAGGEATAGRSSSDLTGREDGDSE